MPGDLVELDTLSVTILPGIRRFHFSARDAVAKWDVAEVATRATSRAALRILDALCSRLPFPIQRLQIDGGSEWRAAFEKACQARHIPLSSPPAEESALEWLKWSGPTGRGARSSIG